MKNGKLSVFKSLPVFMAFIVMGFVDIIGVSTGYVKKDFGLQDKVAQLVPSMALVWFFFLSVPFGILLDRVGKKNMLNIGIVFTAIGMVIPFTCYTFPVMLTAFTFLGIGNTIIQVAANPLLHDVVPKDKYSSNLSLSQFVKAIISMTGPLLAAFMASWMGNWKLVFLVYGVTSLITLLWLFLTPIEEAGVGREASTFTSCFSLLKNRFILLMVLGIFAVVGADVGMNSNIANYLQAQFGLSLDEASLGISIYFAALMIGRVLGAILLNWVSPHLFFIATTLVCLLGILAMLLAPSLMFARIAIVIVGLGAANTFPLIFAISVEKMPDRLNEISGLMVMAIVGGAFVPPMMGYVSSTFGVLPSFWVLVAVMLYILSVSIFGFMNRKNKAV